MKKYAQIVFMQGHGAEAALKILDEQGPKAAIEYLAQWDYGDSPVEDKSSRGSGPVWKEGEYLMTFSQSYEYIGLEREVECDE